MTVSNAGQRIIVIGAGISGLAAGYRLQQAGHQVTVLESADHVGGKMTTLERDGFRIDIAATILFATYHRMLQLIDELDLTDQIHPVAATAGIYTPNGPHYLRTDKATDLLFTRLLSLRSKLALINLIRDVRRIKGLDFTDGTTANQIDTESVAAYGKRRLTPQLMESLCAPINDYYLAPAETASLATMFSIFQIISGGCCFGTKNGVQFLPDALARRLDVRLSACATSVEENSTGVTVTWDRPGEAEHIEHADGAVITVPGCHVPTLYGQLPPGQRDFLNQLPYEKNLVIYLGVDRLLPSKTLWLTAPGSKSIIGGVVEHNKGPGRLPTGQDLLSIYWSPPWIERHWERDDPYLVDAAVEGASRLLALDVDGHLVTSHVQRWNTCVVSNRPGDIQALTAFVHSLSRTSRVQLAGDYFAGLPCTNSSLVQGERAADRLLEALIATRSSRKRR
ncbi:protoporphyrinogen/coproporphyrinogen oxidase [Streptomyces sp. NPDC020379]|uniref:protoporphyrinogen/coproporphyrinogen oxidase n=1 Tax=Streptomyces sp. NPDC020379 TaxID=3365071 RepID=UPI0037B7CF0C